MLAFRYGEAVAAGAPRSLQRLSARELARLMQAAHHPVITAHRRSSKAVWQVVMSRLGGVGSKLAGGPSEQACALGWEALLDIPAAARCSFARRLSILQVVGNHPGN